MKFTNFIIIVALTFFFYGFQIITNAREFKGAEYRTKEAYTYGRFEVRMKSANREGMLSSFFTYFDGTPSDPWAPSKWNEIDLEIMGRYDDNIQFNTITPGSVNHVSHFPMSSSPDLDYHVYAFEWTPDYVAWFLDGVEVLRQTGAHIATLNRPQKIMMNVWNPLYEDWAGVFDPVSLPAFAYYDWVSYYSYTPGTGNYGTGNNFTNEWTDNFDAWDTVRWEKATHTWAGNGCDFIEENAVFQDGKLVLCLTNSTNTGFTDVTSPTVLWARVNSINKITVAFSEEIDKTDAEDVSNYFVTATEVSINSATLRQDLKSVDLTVNGIDLNNSYLLIIYPIRDRATIPNVSNTEARSIIMSQPLSFPIKINCAGPAVLDYLPGAIWNQNTEYGTTQGNGYTFIYDSALQISGTEEDLIYQSEIYWLAGYKVRVPNGNYDVALMFAENNYDSSGSRIFNIYLEYNLVIENLDIFSQVGKHAALVNNISNLQVDDGVLDIQFADKVDYALINGIVITQNATGIDDKQKYGLNDFKVQQNYPNPFNGKTVINYSLQVSDNITFQLYNILGEEIFFENLGSISEGSHQYYLDTAALKEAPLPSGIYFYVFSTSNRRETRKMVLLN